MKYNDPLLDRAILNFDIYSFFDDYNINYKESGKNIGNDFIGVSPCPFCGDTKYHFGIHRVYKTGTCWICGNSKWLPGLVAYYGNMSIKAAIQLILETIEDNNLSVVDKIREIINPTKQEQTRRSYKIIKLPPSKKITNKLIHMYPPLKNFMRKRDLHLWDCDYYNLTIGTSGQNKGCLILPIYYKNKLVAYQSRRLSTKYYSSQGNIPDYFLQEDKIDPDKPTILVEGYFDLIRVDTLIRAHKWNVQVISGLTKQLSETQKQKINKKVKNGLICLFDYDAWYDYLKLKDELCIDVDFAILPNQKDPSDMTWKELEKIFYEVNLTKRSN